MKTQNQLTNRILSLVLALVMVVSILPLSSLTVFAAGASTPMMDGDHIYANGTPLYIEAGTTSGTAIYYLNGSQKVYLNANGAAGDDLSDAIVWGGYYENALDGDVNITMTGGTISHIYGTGRDYDNPDLGYVKNVNITISGGTVTDEVNAGWRNPVLGNVNIIMTGGSVNTIYGCCASSQADVGNSYVKVHGNVNITVTGGTVSRVHGGDGYNPINGTVSGLITVPVTFLNYSTFDSDMTANFDNLLYLKGSAYVYKGQVSIPSGVTMTVAAGQSLTVASGQTLINNGTLVNNGTVTINGVLRNNGSVVNNGTFKRNAAYITTGASGTPSVWANGSAVSGAVTEYADGKLYIYGVTGNIKATLNGKDYYGCQQSGSSTELTANRIAVTDLSGFPTQMNAYIPLTLQAVVSPENTTLPQTISYEVVDAGGTGATVSGNVLNAYGSGTVKLRAKATDGYFTYTKDFSVTVSFVPVTGLSSAVPSTMGLGTYILPGVAPSNASTKTVVWSVVSAGDTNATITDNQLTIKNKGTLKIKCLVKNGVAYGQDYTQEFTITATALDYVDISAGSVTIAKKDDQTLTVTYSGFDGGSKDYGVNEIIPITGTTTVNTVTVQSGNPRIQITDLSIDVSNTTDTCAFYISSGANVTLILNGTNVLKSGGGYITSGIYTTCYGAAGLEVPSGACITIEGAGQLTAYSNFSGAGIGGGYNRSAGTITINSGTIIASSGKFGAGIGGGDYKGSGGTITINGGTVIAAGGANGAGIGGGGDGSGGTITINGGTVTAIGGGRAAGIGGGWEGNGGTVKITGGNVKATGGYSAPAIGKGYDGSKDGTLTNGTKNVSLVTVTLDGAVKDTAVSAVTGMTYGVTDVKTLDTNKLYFYLPADTAPTSITAGGKEYVCNGELTYYTEHAETENATCSMLGTCTRCGATTGNLDPEAHAPSADWSYENGYHYHKCVYGCGAHLDETACSGGKATCVEKAVCDTCGNAYGEVDLTNHVSTETYYKLLDNSTHGKYASCCDTLIESGEHNDAGAAATCTGVAICSVCESGYGSVAANAHTGKLEPVYVNSKNHRYVWNCCNMPEPDENHNLSYTADEETDTITAVCSDCGAAGTYTMTVNGGTYNGYAFKAGYNSTGIFYPSYNALVKPTITYCCEGGCIKAGDHTATMTLGGATVTAKFTIEKKLLTLKEVQVSYKSYDGNNSLNLDRLKLDGVVVYSPGYYEDEWDDVRDDVRVDVFSLNITAPDCIPGDYETVIVTGIKLIGADADNYTIEETDEAVPVRDSDGHQGLTIYEAQIWIVAEDQVLEGNEVLDQTAYTVEGLEDQFEISGIELEEDENWVAVVTDNIKITLNGEDVTKYFEIQPHDANLVKVCVGHEVNEYGFCSTGNCDAYDIPNKVSEIDEYGDEYVLWYEIANAGQLYWYAQQVNDYSMSNTAAKLVADIQIPATVSQGGSVPDWTPINNLYANFDGQGHSISGLYVDSEDTFAGLFSYYGSSTISNLTIKDSYFKGENVGAIAGYVNFGKIANCAVDSTVTVSGTSSVGGLVGYSYGTVKNCYSAAAVPADGDALVGANRGTVTNCYYLDTCGSDDDGTSKTAAQFASGEVAYLLQAGVDEVEVYDDDGNLLYSYVPDIWGQTIGEDAYPVLYGAKVYQVKGCDGETNVYSNINADGAHNYVNGACSLCGAEAPHGLLGDLDLDGDVDSEDLTLLARHVGGIELVEGQALANADVNGDGDVDADDLTKLARYVGGIITDLDQE